MSPPVSPPQERLADNKAYPPWVLQNAPKEKDAILPQFPHLPNGSRPSPCFLLGLWSIQADLLEPCVWGSEAVQWVGYAWSRGRDAAGMLGTWGLDKPVSPSEPQFP